MVNNPHDRAMRDGGVAPLHHYDLRHCFTTRAAERGTDLVTLALMMDTQRIQIRLPDIEHQTSAMEKVLQHNAAQEVMERSAAVLPDVTRSTSSARARRGCSFDSNRDGCSREEMRTC